MAKVKRRRNDMAIEILGRNIRKYRKMRKMTIAELAFRIDADYSQIGRMERGKINFSVSLIFDIAAVLDIPAAQLLEESDSQS